MTEAGMVALVAAALGRPCACQAALRGLDHGNVCPPANVPPPEEPKWHTWRRRTAPGAAGFNLKSAAAFVGEDVGNQAGTFKSNFANAQTCHQMVVAAGPLGYNVAAADGKAPYRAVVTPTVVPDDAELAFYTHWIQQARHE